MNCQRCHKLILESNTTYGINPDAMCRCTEPKTPQDDQAKMSWDEPIEREILSYVRSMKRQWQTQVYGNIWRSDKSAQIYVNAYETVENHILREMRLRDHV